MTRKKRLIGLLSSVAAALATPLLPAAAAEPVDVELILAVDVSLSMSPMELEIQRSGYAAALRDKTVIDAIRSGMHGRIAVTYFEWAGNATQHVIVPWTMIGSAEDAEEFTAKLTASPHNSARRTSISAALEFAEDLFAESGFKGMKRVIDVSGDGPNNQGPPVADVRDKLVAQGIIINGLPLMTNGGVNTGFDLADLDDYYKNCVIGGPGAFVIPVNAWEQFPEAIRRKLVLELASNDLLPVVKAQYTVPGTSPGANAQSEGQAGGIDCMIGEKQWRNRSYMWDMQ